MKILKISCMMTLAAMLSAGAPTLASAQAPADPHHPVPAAPGAGGAMPLAAEGRSSPGMGQGMSGMMGMMHNMRPRMAGRQAMAGQHAHALKFFFAIADTDRDTALSFEEISAIHRRVFDAVDADRNGKVTREEVQAFLAN